MLKMKSKVQKPHTINVSIVLDESGSMAGCWREALKSVNRQLQTCREESAKTGINTKITIRTFSNAVHTVCQNLSLDEIEEIDENTRMRSGGTALYDAMWQALTGFNHTAGEINLLFVITDGEENQSSISNKASVPQLIQNLGNYKDTTIAFAGPPGSKNQILNVLRLPTENIIEWENTTAGAVAMSAANSIGTRSYYMGATLGATQSTSFYSPSLSNLNPAVVKTNLNVVTSQFTEIPVDKKEQISKFVTAKGLKFNQGRAWYELTKTEEVQDYKNLVLKDLHTGTLYSGDEIRSLLQIPTGGTIKLNPTAHPRYKVFVRSMSWNRNLVPNTTLLVSKTA